MNVWCQIMRSSSFLCLESVQQIYFDSASLNSITLISTLLKRVSDNYCFSNVFVEFYIFHSFHRRGTLCLSMAEYFWTSGEINFLKIFQKAFFIYCEGFFFVWKSWWPSRTVDPWNKGFKNCTSKNTSYR